MNKYDAARNVYYEVDIDKMAIEMQSFNLTEEEIAPKIEAAKQKVAEKVAAILGADVETVALDVAEDGTITVEAAPKPVEEALAEEEAPIEEEVKE